MDSQVEHIRSLYSQLQGIPELLSDNNDIVILNAKSKYLRIARELISSAQEYFGELPESVMLNSDKGRIMNLIEHTNFSYDKKGNVSFKSIKEMEKIMNDGIDTLGRHIIDKFNNEEDK